MYTFWSKFGSLNTVQKMIKGTPLAALSVSTPKSKQYNTGKFLFFLSDLYSSLKSNSTGVYSYFYICCCAFLLESNCFFFTWPAQITPMRLCTYVPWGGHYFLLKLLRLKKRHLQVKILCHTDVSHEIQDVSHRL